MPRYIVGIPEVHVQNVEVVAESPEQALVIASEYDDRSIKLLDTVYAHTLDNDEQPWHIHEVTATGTRDTFKAKG